MIFLLDYKEKVSSSDSVNKKTNSTKILVRNLPITHHTIRYCVEGTGPEDYLSPPWSLLQ